MHSYQGGSSWGRRLGIAVLVVVALAVAGYVGSVVGPHFKSNGGPTSATTTTSAHPSSTTTSTTPHATVKVLVANGTQEPNTAAHFSQILQQQGWDVQTPTNTTTPAATTTVYYAAFWPESAKQIATELGVPVTSTQPLTSSVPVADTSGIDVVVVIGSDLAGSGFPATTVPTASTPTTTVPTTTKPATKPTT
jgi:LytR cell envelope-related transcriptional attenuator